MSMTLVWSTNSKPHVSGLESSQLILIWQATSMAALSVSGEYFTMLLLDLGTKETKSLIFISFLLLCIT